VAQRILLVAPVFAAAVCGHIGARGLAFALLLAAVPVAGVGFLQAVADYVDGKADRSRAVVAAGALTLIVSGAATRSPVLVSACLALFAADALLALAAEVRTEANSRRAARA
jgi:hypothetical protein